MNRSSHHADIETGQLVRVVLSCDESLNVRVVNSHHTHLCATSVT